ncbi:TPA: hypothetical protein NKR50_004451 [Vibrio parahaemolyticus]|uniref:hypothetical protein n=1 Tax=Vibrio alginolyticus TaxID=663 RepID=UPI001BD525CB|nr:hypothetical protein [Vibrio alginolyticus]MBS9917033.1 hypothetical protein [Vibrio alginolyticus]HCH2025621.1 hypothetical protein [Vibrio parahaemolyticus]HCM1028071.1 hypothetical protein [Vibrio parahaemolyticus]
MEYKDIELFIKENSLIKLLREEYNNDRNKLFEELDIKSRGHVAYMLSKNAFVHDGKIYYPPKEICKFKKE